LKRQGGKGDGVGSLKSCETTKEADAARRTVSPSSEMEARIERMLSVGSVKSRASRCLRGNAIRDASDAEATGRRLRREIGRLPDVRAGA
jgi:hypothetical protein